MTLLYLDGFDAQDYSLRYSVSGTTTGMGTTSSVRPGATGLSWRSNTSSTGSSGLFRYIPATPVIIVGMAVKQGTSFSFSYISRILSLHSPSGAHICLNMKDNPNSIEVSRGATTAINSLSVAMGTWGYLEVKASLADTGGQIEIRWNGVVIYSYTGDTRFSGTDTSWTGIGIGDVLGGTVNNDDSYYDDLYVVGGADWASTNYLGEVQVRALPVTGAGTSTGMTPVGSANNWENVDEFPPNTADYNYSTVSGTKDTYTMGDITLNAGERVLGVQVSTASSTITAGTSTGKTVLRSGGTDYSGTATVVNSTPSVITTAYENDPATGSPWTVSGVNSAEAGFEVG